MTSFLWPYIVFMALALALIGYTFVVSIARPWHEASNFQRVRTIACQIASVAVLTLMAHWAAL